MREVFLKNLMTAIAATAAICCQQTSFASTDANDSLITEMSLMTSTTFSLGEPIILRSQVVNTSHQTLAVHLGAYHTEWYSLSLTDAEGRPVPNALDNRRPEPSGLQANADRPISPGDDITGYIVVTRAFILRHPGQYRLTVHVHMPYGQVSPDDKAPRIWKKAIADDGTVATQDFTYPFSVTPADVKKIRQTSARLQQEIGAHLSSELNHALVSALFSMPEAEAATNWRVLAESPGMASEMYATELKHLGTATAADILAGMLSNTDLSADDKTYIGQCLNEMYNVGAGPLRHHIAQIATTHGLSLPERVTIPVASD